MKNFTFDETMLMAIYNTGTREGLIRELSDMRKYLEPDEKELLDLTDSVIEKLESMTDAEFETVDLVADIFETEDVDGE